MNTKTLATSLAALACVVALGAGYMIPGQKSGATMDEKEQAEQNIAQQKQDAKWLMEHGETELGVPGNPFGEIAKILRGRAEDDLSLTEQEKKLIYWYRKDIEEQREIASGKREPMYTHWVPPAHPTSVIIAPHKKRPE